MLLLHLENWLIGCIAALAVVLFWLAAENNIRHSFWICVGLLVLLLLLHWLI